MLPLATPLLICLVAPSQAAPTYTIETGAPKRFTAEYRTDIRGATFNVVEWNVYIALAPDLPSQTQMKTILEPEGVKIEELSEQKRPILHAKVVVKDDKRVHELPVSVKYEGSLIPRRLVALRPGSKPPQVVPLAEGERKLYLAETKLHDFTAPPFQEWLERNQLQRRKNEGEVDFGRRVFQVVTRQFQYQATGEMASVSKLCARTKADCDIMSAIMVSALRANQVPARMLVGLPAKALTPTQGSIIGHARIEFFAVGVGWIPADPAFGSKLKDPSSEFGQDRGDLVVGHVDYEVVVPMPSGPRMQYNLGKPAFHASGRGKFDVKFYPVSWQVTFP